jgi:hypothetical protein
LRRVVPLPIVMSTFRQSRNRSIRTCVWLAGMPARLTATWRHARSFDGDYGKRFDREVAMAKL